MADALDNLMAAVEKLAAKAISENSTAALDSTKTQAEAGANSGAEPSATASFVATSERPPVEHAAAGRHGGQSRQAGRGPRILCRGVRLVTAEVLGPRCMALPASFGRIDLAQI